MTDFEELLFETVKDLRAEVQSAVKELRTEIQSVRSEQCRQHGELSEVKQTVARIDERQKAQTMQAAAPEPNRAKQAVAVTVSLAGLGGLGAAVWNIVKALSSG